MRKKITVAVVVGLIVLGIAGGVGWLFYSGKLVWAGDGSQAQGKVVCGDDVVKSFNQARELVFVDDVTEPTIDEDGQRRIADEVKALPDFQNDPTCQTIIFRVAYLDRDYQAVQLALEAIKSLHENRIYADTNLSGIESITTYSQMVEGLSPENANQGRNGDE
jgi:hypothetical protein